MTAIADQAFANVSKIQKVTIGINITSIGKKAFFKCKKLKNVIIKVKMPKKLKGKQCSKLLSKLKKAGMKVK